MADKPDVTTLRCLSCGEVGTMMEDTELDEGKSIPVVRCTKCGWWG